MKAGVQRMAEYIERELAIEALSRGEGCGNVCRRAIERILAADVAPVRHGRWIMKKTSTGAAYTVCSHCNASVKYNDEYGTVVMNLKGANYCPNCGARMDESTD